MKKGTGSKALFVTKDGHPMRFYVRPGPLKRKLSPLIIEGGGVVCSFQEPGAFLLADPNEECVPPGYVSTAYITDCVSSNRSLSPRAYRLLPPWDRSKNRVKNKSPLFTKSPTKGSPGNGNRNNRTSTVTHPGAEPENSIEEIENSGMKINYGEDDKINKSPAGKAGIKQVVEVCKDVPKNNYTSKESARGLVEGHKKVVHAVVHSTSTDEPFCQEGGQQQPPASSKTAVQQELSREVVNDLEAGTDHESNFVIDEESLFKVEFMRPKRKLRTYRHQSCEGIQQKSNAKHSKVINQADVHEVPRNVVQTTVQNLSHSSEAQVEIEERIEETAEAESSALENAVKKLDIQPTEKPAELDTSLVSANFSAALKRGRMPFTEEEDIVIMQYIRDNVSSKRTVTGNLLWKEMETRKVLNRTWQSIRGRYIKFLANHPYKLQHARLSLDNKGSVKIDDSKLEVADETCSPLSNVVPQKSSIDSYSSPKTPQRSTDKQPGVSVKTPQRHNTIQHSSSAVTPQGINTTQRGCSSEVMQKHIITPHSSSTEALQSCSTKHGSEISQRPNTAEHSSLVEISLRNSPTQHSSSVEASQRSSPTQLNTLAQDPQRHNTIPPQTSPSTTTQHDSLADTPQRPATRRHGATAESHVSVKIPSDVVQTTVQNLSHSSEEQVDIEERIEETAEAESSTLENPTAKESDNGSSEKPTESVTSLVRANSSPARKRRRMFFTEEEENVILQYVRDNVSSKRTVTGSLLWKDMEKRKVLSRNWQVIKAYYFKYLVNEKSKLKHARLSLQEKGSVEMPSDVVQTTVQNLSHSSEAQVDIEERIEETAEAESSALENSTAKESDKRPTEKQAESDTSLVRANSSTMKQGKMPFTEEEDIAILQYVRDNVSSKRTVTGTLLWKDMETKKVLNRTWQSIKGRYVQSLVNQKHKLQHGRLSLDNNGSVKIKDSKLEFANETCSPLSNVDPQKSSTDLYSSPEAPQRPSDKQPGVSVKTPHNGTQHISSPKTLQRHNTIQHSPSAVTPQELHTTPRGSSSEAIQKHITPQCSSAETLQRPNTTEHSYLIEISLRHSPTQLNTLVQDPLRSNTIPPETSPSSTAQHNSLADTPERHATRRHGSSVESPHKYGITQHGSSLETSQKSNGIPPTDSTQTPQICETTEMGTSGDGPQRCDRTKHGDGMLTFSPSKSHFPDRETSSGLDDLHIFEIANMEFEIDEPSDSGEEAPMADLMEAPAGTSSAPTTDDPSTGPEASDHNGLQKAITDMMGEFNLTMCCVMQALYFNNGELGSTRHFLRTGARPDGYPIWGHQDDSDLKQNGPSPQTHLIEKYGGDNVAKRLAFLLS